MMHGQKNIKIGVGFRNMIIRPVLSINAKAPTGICIMNNRKAQAALYCRRQLQVFRSASFTAPVATFAPRG